MRRLASVLLPFFLLGLIPLTVMATSGLGTTPAPAPGADTAVSSDAVPLAASAATGSTRGTDGAVASEYALELDGQMVGSPAAAEGGYAFSDVVQEKMGPDLVTRKHVAGVKYEDITLTVGANMDAAFYQWVKDSFDHKYSRKNGAIIAADFNHREISRREFFNAVITEVALPALDASSKDAAKMTVKLSPEYTRRDTSHAGEQLSLGQNKGQKQWLPANFRLRIDGLEDAAARVNKVEALVVKQGIAVSPIGNSPPDREPTSPEIPNLVVTLPESHADAFYKWHEDFVIKGNNGQEQEKSGSLEFLAPDLQTVLFTVTMGHLGIFKLAPEKVEAGHAGVAHVTAQMYAETMTFDYHR